MPVSGRGASGPKWSLRFCARRSLTGLIAPAAVMLVACQAAGDGSIQPTTQLAPGLGTPLLAPNSTVIGVTQTANAGEIVLQFVPGTSSATARAVGQRYGIDLIGGPVLSGIRPSGQFTFQMPQVKIEATTPTTARVYFPTFIKPSDRRAYLSEHHLQLIRMVRGMDDVMVAIVRLPETPLNPTLLDPIAGLFQVALPAELENASVSDWAKTLAMRVISYDPATGSTVLHPDSWHPILPRPIAYSRPQTIAPPSISLYVQFPSGTSPDIASALVKKVGLTVVSVDSTSLAALSGDPASTRAAIQLLSDNPAVQCVSTSPNPCAAGSAGVNAVVVAPPPTYGQPSSVSVRVVDGLLDVSWTAASGATAYAIFRTSSSTAPYELVAIVAGQDHTSYTAFDQTPTGSSAFYEVVALHPCAGSSDGGTCDAALVPFTGQGTLAWAWTNPVVVQQAPPPSPGPAPSPTPTTVDPAQPSPSPVTDAAPIATPAPPPPAPVVQPPAQTRLGAPPLDAPAAVNVEAVDGHVNVSWQAVQGAKAYRVYRAGGGAAAYLVTTSELSFTDTGGVAGSTYTYMVAAIAESGLLGKTSAIAGAVWQPSTTAPVVLRSLPAEAGGLSGRIRFQVDARSGDGRGQVQWRLTGPAANLTIGMATGQPTGSPLTWSTELAWDSATVPDGSYTVTATITGSSGQQSTMSSTYRIQNAAPVAPINLTAVSQASDVALTWEQAASATGVSYKLFRDQPVSGTRLTELSSDRRSFVDAGVQPGRHQYSIVLVDAQGRSSEPASTQVVVGPAADAQPEVAPELQVLLPTGQALAPGGRVTDRLLLVAPAMSNLSFQLSSDGRSWRTLTQTTNCAQDACSLDLSMDALASGPYSVRAATAREAGAAHTFVRADAVRYGAPTALSAELTGLGVQLSWTAPASALPASYQVSRRAQGGAWKLLDQVASTTYIDARAPAGGTSDYRVSGVDPEGQVGTASSPVSVSVPWTELAELYSHGPPSAPTRVEVIASHGRAAVRWDPVSGSDGYLVERLLEPDGALAIAGRTSGESFVDSPAAAAREVGYRVIPLIGVVEGSASTVTTTLVIPVAAPAPLIQSSAASTRPAAPSSLTATTQSGSVQISWSAGSASSTPSTYSVYRLDPATGAFGLAAAGLDSSSFNDAALRTPARFGYVVTATSASGLESLFSDPVWVTVTPGSAALNVELLAPTTDAASFISSESLQALAQVTAAAGIDQVSYAISPLGGLWKQLSAVPVDPRRPIPAPAISVAPAALWGTILNTTSLAPGSYRLRVQVRDRAGNTQEKVQDLLIAGPAARGPPSIELNANAIPGGVHLHWSNASSDRFLVQRSLFGPVGPFETLATTQAQQYDDQSGIAGQPYSYRVTGPGTTAVSNIATGTAFKRESNPSVGAPSVLLGDVTDSELALTISSAPSSHALPSGLSPIGATSEVNAASLATGQQVHRLGEVAQITFLLPPGMSLAEASSTAIYHWDDGTASWMRQESSFDSSTNTLTASINHLSEFTVAITAPTSSAGGTALPPAPPTDFRGTSDGSDPIGPDGEIISMRTENSQTFKNADGSLRQVITAGLVNYKDSNGAWQKIDTSLVPGPSGATYVRNAAGPVEVHLPGDGASPVVVTTAGGSANFALEGASRSSRSVSGSDAEYQDVLSGVNATYTVLPEGLKENLVIASKTGRPPVFVFNLTTNGLVLSRLQGGNILAKDAAGKVQFTITSPWMHDAPSAKAPEGATSDKVAVTLEGASGSYRLTYRPDPAWLADPARRYPVTVDPSLTYNYAYGGEYDTQINTCSPNYNYHAYTYLPIGATPFNMGTYWCYGPSRAMVQFGIPIGGTKAYSAQLKLYQYVNTNGGGWPIYAEPAAGPWSFTGVTWNNQPGGNCFWGCPSMNSLGTAGWISWDVTSVVQAWQNGAFPNNGFVMVGYENGCVPYCNEEFFASVNYSNGGARAQLTLNWYDESGTVAWQGPAHTVTAVAGTLFTVPLTVTNTANQVGGSLTWRAFNYLDMVRVGVRDYQAPAGGTAPISNLPNLRNYLPTDIGPGGSASMNAVFQAPADPGDYLLRVDLAHETPTSTIWFSERGNQPLVVRVRVLAPGDDTTTHVPVVLGDGTSLAINTSNGFATLAATDFNIPERGSASLRVGRTYNGVNALLSSVGTGNASSAFGQGWTFDFQRLIHLGSLSANGYDLNSGIVVDGLGRVQTLTWDQARGVYLGAGGTLAPSTAQVISASGTSNVPGVRPVDLLNGSVGTDTSPGGFALKLEASSGAPSALVMLAGLVPAQQNGTIEFWFKPNFDMSNAASGCHVFFADPQMRFGLAWNCLVGSYSWGSPTGQQLEFFTYDGSAYNLTSVTVNTWGSATDTANGGWHHVSLTWADGGATQLIIESAQATNVAVHVQASVGDLVWGYQPNANSNALNYLNGRIAQLRIEGRVVGPTELANDAVAGATVAGTINTLYLGRYDSGSAASSAGTYVLRNSDQSTETYSSYGVLQGEADRNGNQIDYLYDSSGNMVTISDHFIPGRTIRFDYTNPNSIVATDLAGRTVTYQLSGGDLISVTKRNQVPDPFTGVITVQNPVTKYAYTPDHLLRQVTDPKGARTTVNYDQSYRQVVMADNPVGYWRLGDTSGQATDTSGNAHPSTVANAITYGAGDATSGDPDLAMGFNGTSSYVSIPYSAGLAPAPAISLELWMKTSSNPGLIAVLLDDENGGFAKGAKLNYDATGHAQFQLDPGVVLTSGVLSLNAWHHVVGTYDGTNARLYVDGALAVGPIAGPYVANDGGAITLGAITNVTSNFWNGNLDEAAVYSTALTATRIHAHFVAGRLGIGASTSGYAANIVDDSPIGYWRLDESTGSRAYDLSGFANNASYAGGVALAQTGAFADDSDAAATFNGSTAYVATPTQSITTAITVEAWINASTYSQNGFIVAKNPVNANWELFVAAGILYWRTGGGGCGGASNWTDLTTPAPSASAWHHIVAVQNGATAQIFIDGVQVAISSVMTAIGNSTGTIDIGHYATAGACPAAYFFNGLIDEVAIYATALPGARILAHYSAGRPASIFATPAYRMSVMADQPTGYWRLDESAGTSAADTSSTGNAATYTGGFTLGRAGALATDTDTAVGLNGSTGYISITDKPVYATSQLSVEAWVKATTWVAGGSIVNRRTAGNVGGFTMDVANASGQIVFYVYVGTTWYPATSPWPLATGGWHHLAGTYDGAAVRLYVDGTLAASTPISGAAYSPTGPLFQIGHNAAGAAYFNGSIDEVALYPSALSAARVLLHFQTSELAATVATGWNEGSYSGPVAADRPVGFWRLDDPVGAVYTQDRSGANNTGTYSGVTLGQPGALLTEPNLTAAFNGAGYVVIPASPSLNVAGPMSIEAWIYKPAAATGPIVEFNNGSAVGVHVWNYNTSDALYVNFTDTAGGVHNLQSPGGQFVLNSWYHVAAVYDGAYGSLYIDGALVARAYLGPFTPQTNMPLYIARRPSGSPNYYLNASIADVALYPYALTASRVLAHYNAAWDRTQMRVSNVQDARGNTVATLRYNDDLATTQVIDARGLPSYYTFQQFGGRTMSITDTGNNVTRYEYDGGAAYRLVAVVSPGGIRHTRVMNSGGPVGQQAQVLMEDDANQPSTTYLALMSGGYPDPTVYGATSLSAPPESWIWDSGVMLQPGVPSHRSTPGGGFHQHYLSFGNGVLIPAGSRLLQWVYVEPGTQAPDELMLQFHAADTTTWSHRYFWGQYNLRSDLGSGCPANCWQSADLPVEGKWVLLTVALGPREGAAQQTDVDMAGRTMDGIAFSLENGGGAVWWGPTTLELPAPSVSDPTRAIKRYAYNATNDMIASVDANGIAKVTDFDGLGQARQVASGVLTTATQIMEDTLSYAGGGSPWTFEFGYPNTANGTSSTVQYNNAGINVGSLTQTHTGAGLQSDLYIDRAGLVPGTYIRVTVWAQTANGSGAGGASLAVESTFQGVIRRSASVQSPTWVQLSLPFIVDSSGKVRIHLWHENFSGVTYWADVRIEDITPAPDVTLQPTGRQSAWALTTAAGVSATWSNVAWGGVGNAPARKVSVTSPTTSASDVADTLTTPTLRSGATYVLSVWAGASVPGTTIDFSLRDSSGVLLPLDNSNTSCAIGTSPTLCQNSLTYTGPDFALNRLTVRYGGFGVRDIYISHPVAALTSELRDYTPFGQVTRVFDIFGHETRTDYDAQSLHVVQTTTKSVANGAPASVQAISYASQVLADAPQGYWRLGETSGTSAADSSGHPASTGTISGGVTMWVPGALPSDFDRALSFNGSSGTVSATVSSIDTVANHQVTVEFWMNWSGGAGAQIPFGFANYALELVPGIGFGFFTGNSDLFATPSSAVPANKWVHVAAIFTNANPAQNQLYLNGVSQTLAQTGTRLSRSVGTQVNISGWPTSTAYMFGGTVDEVSVYNGALGATRIQAHYLAARAQLPSASGSQANYASSVLFDQPKGYWRLGELATNIAGDSSGYGQHSTYGGGYALGQSGAFAGDPNASVSLNGTNAYVITGNMIGLFPSLAVSIEAWFYARGPGVLVTELGAAAFNNSTWHDSQMEVVDVGGGRADVRVRVWALTAVSLGQVAYNTWHHAVMRYDGSVLDGFLDGVKSSTSVTGTRAKPSALYYGFGGPDTTNMGSGAYFNGLLDDVAVYAAPLSSDRVSAHFQAGAAAMTAQPTYAGAVLSGQPLGDWRLDEASGLVAADSSPNGSAGTISGAVTYGMPGALLTDSDRAMRFDASTGTVALKLPKIDTTGGHQVSVEFWMNWAGGGGMPFGFSSYDLYLVAGSGFGFNTGNGDLYGVTLSAIPQNTWIHVAAVFTNGAVLPNQLYLNGVRQGLVQILASPLARSVTTTANISGWPNGGYRWNGRLDEVAIYNAALAPSTVLSHYLSGRAQGINLTPYPSTTLADGPLGYWRVGETTGTVAVDASGNGQTGAYVGGYTLGQPGALTFDTDTAVALSGGYVTTPAFNLPSFSAEVWWDGTPGTNGWSGPMQQRQAGYNGFQFVNNAADLTRFTPHLAIWNGSAESRQFQSTVSYAMPFGAMKHFVWTYDGSSARLFVNGTEVTVQTSTVGGWPNSCTCIGYGYQPVGGRVDEVAVYGYPLAPTRVAAHYQAATSAIPVQYTPPTAPTPPPSIVGMVTAFQDNSLGQEVSTTRISGATQITLKHELDSWGRITADIQNYVAAGPTDAQTNVRTGHVYDLNANPTDTYTQGAVAGTWIDAHIDYDLNGNVIDQVSNYGAGQETATVNVTTRFVYDVMNQRTDSIAPLATTGGSTTVHKVYDNSGRVTQSVSNYVPGALGDWQTNVTTTTTYDADGRVVTLWKPLGTGQVPMVSTYDGIGRLVRQVAGTVAPPAGFQAVTAQMDWTFDLGGRTVDQLGPGTGSPAVRYDTHYDLDALGRKLYVTAAYGCSGSCTPATTRYVYDPRGAVVTYSPPTQQLPASGVATRSETDLAGHAVRSIRDWQAGGGSGPDRNVTTSVAYDGFGRPTDGTDPRNVVTHTVYDALDRPVSVTLDPTGLNLTTSYTYNLAGDRTQVKTPRDVSGPRIDQTVYDALHRPITVYQNCVNCLTTGTPDTQTNIKTDATYDSLGAVLTVSQRVVPYTGATPFVRVSQTDYDHMGRKIDQIQNCVPASCTGATAFDQNVTTTWSIDSSGLVLSAISPRQCVTSTTDPCVQGYGGATVADAGNLTTGYGYDALGRLVKVLEDQTPATVLIGSLHLNLATAYAYDPAGNLVSMTDALNHTTTYKIDPFGRVTMVTDPGDQNHPAGNSIVTTYSPAGEIISVMNARGTTNIFTLDQLGRVLREDYFKALGSAAAAITFTYDASGNRTSFANSDVAASTVTYDNANRVTGVGVPGGAAANCVTPPAGAEQTCYHYFADGAIKDVTDATGKTTFTEDQLGRLATTTDPLLPTKKTTYTFDSLSRLTTRAEASGVTTSVPTSGGYSGLDQLIEKDMKVGSTIFAKWINSYDIAGNRLSENTTLPNDTLQGANTFQYDTVEQLAYVNGPGQAQITYQYDPAHNRSCLVSAPGTNCSPNSGGLLYSYQPNNAISSTAIQTVGQSPTTFTNDADGNLISDSPTYALTYDSLNQLEQSVPTRGTTVTFTYDGLGRLATRTAGPSVTRFVYRGLSDEQIQEKDGAGATLRSYAWDSREHRLAVTIPTVGTFAVLTNPHGDVVGLATGTGVIQGWTHYDAYGKVLASGGTQIPFGYQGDYTDPIGYVHMGARWYWPLIGRFLTSDPSAVSADTRSPLSRQRWIYAGDSPLRYSDPTGLYLAECGPNGDRRCKKGEEPGTQDKTPEATTPPDPTGPSTPRDDGTTVTTCDQACIDAYIAKAQKAREQQAAAAQRKKNCDWWDIACNAKKTWNDTTKVIGDAWNACKSSDICKTAVTIGVGVAVFAGCTALTAGVGAVGCAVAAGAVSGAVSGAMDCKSGQSMGACMATGAVVGAVTGLAGGVAGKVLATVATKVLAPAATKAFGAVLSRLASKAAGAEAQQEGAVLRLAYKPGWNAIQRSQADAKASAMNHMGDMVVTQVERKGTTQAAFRRLESLSKSQDADHIKELQLGGQDAFENIWGLDSSVNRSMGSQIKAEIARQGLQEGAPVARIIFGEWGL